MLNFFKACFFPTQYSVEGVTYTEVEEWRQGGFATIRVVRREEGEDVALKHVLCVDDDASAAVAREVEIQRRFSSLDGVCPILGFEVIPSSLPGTKSEALIIMPFFDRSVQDMIDSKGRLTVTEAVAYARDTCRTLTEMHAQGFAHRDIKPGNMLISDVGRVVLTDFGSAGNAHIVVKDAKEAMSVEELAASTCTAPYRAPELHSVEHEVTEKVDIFSLGASLFYMLTGRPAFDGTALSALSGAVAWEQKDRDAVGAKLVGLVDEMVRLDPEKRPSAAQIVSRL